MPLSPQQKTQLVQLHGLDPASWTASDDGSQLMNIATVTSQVVAPPVVQPAPTQQVSPTPQVSATGAFLKSAIHAAPEAAGSGVGAGTGLAFGLGLAPETGGLSMLIPLATTLAGGYLGGKVVSSVQQAAEAKMPDYQAQLQQAEQQHPVASKLGQLSTIPLGGLNFNPANVVRASGGLAKMLLSEGGATPEEAANVLNVGAGAVLGGVQSGLSGGSVGDIAQNAAIGALFNDPNAIGKRLGFHPVTQRPILDPDTYAQMLSQKSDSTGEEIVNPTPSNVQPSIPDVSSTSTGLPFSQGSVLKKRIPYLENTDTQPSELSTMQAEGGLDKDVIAAQKEDFNPESGQPYIGKELDRNQEPQAGRLLTPAGKALQQHVADLQAKYPGLDVSTIPPEYLKAMSEQVSGLHGIETTPTEGITDQNGQPVKGTALVGTQKTSINPTLADAGTQPHEDFHHIFGTMPATTKAELLNATKNEFDAFNASRVQAGQPAFTHEEYLATEMGYRTVSRLLNASGETPLKQWWNDFKSGVKVKFGAEPTVEDLYRNNVYKLIHGKSNVAAAGLHPGVSQNQEDETSPKFIGHQDDFSGKTSGFDLYNLQQPILDKDGKVLHSAGSTVSEGTLTKYGIQIPKHQEGEEGITKLKYSPNLYPRQDTRDLLFKTYQDADKELSYYSEQLRKQNKSHLIKTDKGYEFEPGYDNLVKKRAAAFDTWHNSSTDWDYLYKDAQVGHMNGFPVVKTSTQIYIKKEGKWYSKVLFAKNADGTPATLHSIIMHGNQQLEHIPEKIAKLDSLSKGLKNQPGDEVQIPGKNPFSNVEVAPPQKQPLLHATMLEQKNPAQLRVAAKSPDGKIIEGKLGDLHLNLDFPEGSELGFVDKSGNFLNREEASFKHQPSNEGLTPRQVYKAAQYQKNRETMLAQSKANQAANKDEHDQIITGAPRTAGVPPHTYPQDDVGYQPPSSAPMRRIPITMNEGETKVASNVIYKGLNRLFYKNLPMTMIKQWKSEFLPELHDAAMAELSTKGLDVPKSQDHNAETFHADWSGYFQKNPSSLNETIASSAGRRAIEQFSQFTRKFKEQHGYTVSLDTAGIEGRGIQDKVGYIPTSEITSKARQTGPEATETGGTDVKRVQKIKKEAEQAVQTYKVGDVKSMYKDLYDESLNKEDQEMSEHYKSVLDRLEKVPDETPIKNLKEFQDAMVEMSPAKKTEGIGEENKNELDKLKFQGGEEGFTKVHGQELNHFLSVSSLEVENAKLYLDRSEPRVDEAEESKQKILKYASDDLKPMVERADFTTLDGIDKFDKELSKAVEIKMRWQEGNEGLTKKVTSNPDTTPSQKYNFLWIMPELDQARRHAGPTGEPLAKSLQQLPTVRDQMYGKYTSKFLKLADSANEVDKKKVLQTLYREDSEGQSYRNLLTSPKQRALYDEFRRALVEKQTDQQTAGQMVTDFDQNGKKFQRPAKVNPTYAPSILRADVIEQILEHTPKGKQYEAQLLKYWKDQGASDKYAKERLTALKSMEDSTQKNETRFGANRLTEGMGIPPELRVSSLEKMTSRYFSKVATDRAWHDAVEKNPEAMKALEDEDVKHYYGGIIDKIKGEPFDKDTGTIKAWNRLFTSALLGPLTNIHIGMSTFFNPFQYVKGSELASVYFKGMQHIGESAQHAIENGYKRKDLNTVHDIIDSQNTFLQKAGAVSSLIGKVNGREFTDKVAKTFAQALGEEIVPLRIASAKDGDTWSVKMMKQLDANWTPDKVYSKQEQSQMASVLGGMIHGSHDYRTLPEIMNRENIIKPFVSLMSWSVAQTNQWMKHVWEPATTGNLQPLIMSTLGALVGGYVIQQMRQAVTDKKSNIPSLNEIANSSKGVEGNVPLLAYNFMQMASYTGWMGLGSTIGKYGFDAAYKNIPQGATFPLDEAVGSIGSTMNEAVSAWLQSPTSEDFFRIFPKALLDMGKENWQLARIATNWAADYGETGESETYKKEVNTGTGDLRRYRMAEGLPYEQQTESANNPYLNLQQKGFKRTSDLGEAAQDIPGLMQLAMQRSKGNPEVFKSQLESLKQNSFQTMPSPETMPSQFSRYYKYLVSTQGPEVAAQRMQEYMMHSAINRAKAGMIP